MSNGEAGNILYFDFESMAWLLGIACDSACRSKVILHHHSRMTYRNIIVPAMPVKDLLPLEVDSSGGAFPSQLQKSLIKCSKDDKDKLTGISVYKSGVRSSLVRLQDGGWYRLKGCGNHEQGFIIEKVSRWKDAHGVLLKCTFPCWK